MRVLIAWEHGRHMGHLTRLLALARELQTQGAEVVWALPAHESHAAKAVRRAGWGATRAPAVVPRAPRRAAQSFADILSGLGFADEAVLAEQVHAWLDLLAEMRADRVLLDYAPAAQLAAHLGAIPAAQVTNGFDAPLAHCPTFGVSLRGPFVEERNSRALAAVTATIEAVGRRLAGTTQVNLRSMLEHPVRWFDCIPETDPYGLEAGAARPGIFIGPQGAPLDTVDARWPKRSGPRVLAYLRGGSTARLALAVLAERGAATLCAWPDASDDDVRQFGERSVRIARAPLPLAALLTQADVVVNYGSSGFVCQALLSGKPQVVLPGDVEKWLVARRVQALGAAVLAHGESVAEVHAAFDAALGTADAARRVAARYADVTWPHRRADAVGRWLEATGRRHSLDTDRARHAGQFSEAL